MSVDEEWMHEVIVEEDLWRYRVVPFPPTNDPWWDGLLGIVATRKCDGLWFMMPLHSDVAEDVAEAIENHLVTLERDRTL